MKEQANRMGMHVRTEGERKLEKKGRKGRG